MPGSFLQYKSSVYLLQFSPSSTATDVEYSDAAAFEVSCGFWEGGRRFLRRKNFDIQGWLKKSPRLRENLQ